MKKKIIMLTTVVVLIFTAGTSLLSAKFWGSERIIGKCQWWGGGNGTGWAAPVFEKTYVFWIPTGTKPTGEMVPCDGPIVETGVDQLPSVDLPSID